MPHKKMPFNSLKVSKNGIMILTLQYTSGYKAGIKSVHRPADLGRSIHKYFCGYASRPWLVYGQSINQLTLAGQWTVFGVLGPSVTDQQTLAGLWTLFGY